LHIDLTGGWDHDLDAEVRGGVGEATVRLPVGVGRPGHGHRRPGRINVQGLHKEGNLLENDAYGKSDIHVRPEGHRGIGQINLIG